MDQRKKYFEPLDLIHSSFNFFHNAFKKKKNHIFTFICQTFFFATRCAASRFNEKLSEIKKTQYLFYVVGNYAIKRYIYWYIIYNVLLYKAQWYCIKLWLLYICTYIMFFFKVFFGTVNIIYFLKVKSIQ